MEPKSFAQQQAAPLRQPIVTVCGHVDHGKTSILDCFRGSSLQASEAGGITQKISFTKYPLSQVHKACPLINAAGVNLEIPGFLFIDTPGHAAFTNLRKRGGSLADLAIVVVSIKEGIQPQTAEVLQILKAHKTPFVIALNKIDSISGWRTQEGALMKNSLARQAVHAKEEFELSLLTFQDSLREHGFDSALYYDVTDFTKQVAIVPCSARTKEGISELLFALCGLCQKFLRERLKTSDKAKGVILEVKKDRGALWAEAILYDGRLDIGDELIIANFGEPITAKVRALAEILPLSTKYGPVEHLQAATGARMQLAADQQILPGMPFQEVKGDTSAIRTEFKRDISSVLSLDKQGIIVKADSLGSLEALLTLLRQEHIKIVRAGIGPISKSDLVAAKANLGINALDAIIVGFNVEVDEDIEVPDNIEVLTHPVVYKLIEELAVWRNERLAEIQKEKMMGLASICKIEILSQYVFRNSNPAIFGVRIAGGIAKVGIPLIDNHGESIARIKSLQVDKASVDKASEGTELALALPGIMFDRVLKDSKFLYSDISESQMKQFKKHKDLLTSGELSILQEIMTIKQQTHPAWGSA